MGLKERATDQAQLFTMGNGNYYVVSRNKKAVEEVAKAIGRKSGVYYRGKYQVWALRVRKQEDKHKLLQHFGKAPIQGGLFGV